MIRVNGLTKAFGSQKVLDHIDLEIPSGEIFVLLGESGTGKSVLLKHLMGLMVPDEGRIDIDGQDITGLPERDLLHIRKYIGYLFQEGALYDFMDVYDNLAFPLREHTELTASEIRNKVKEVLRLVDLEGIENKIPSELSGGMKKRVGLARSIILDSKIIFCDEPTSGLDPIRSRDIMNLIKRIARDLKCTIVLTSHDIPNSFRIADRVGLLQDGKIKALGSPQELRENQDQFVKEFIN